MSLQIRKATPNDLPFIHTLLIQLGYPEGNALTLSGVFEQIKNRPDMGILIATEGTSEVLGYVLYSWRPQFRLEGIRMEVDELSVSDKARGKGIGSKLLDAVKNRARELGAREVILSTNRQRESYVRGFYAKYGFTEKNSAVMKFDV
jgi:N-acetylglutamate synthase-like GNAT family acetyltransferase